MSDLTAIDILINPDDGALARARTVNARLLQSVPDGFALDVAHAPHVTTLQRFVRTSELAQVFEAVEAVISATDAAALTMRAIAIRHLDWGVPGQGLAGFLIQPAPTVLDFQARLLAAVSPFVASGGTGAAFKTDAGDPPILPATIEWVEHYVPAQIGDKYMPHITLGYGTLEDLKVIEDEPFEAFDVHPASLAVYHLGKAGSARELLQKWAV